MTPVEQAAQNNALWIDRMCRLHRCSTHFRDGAWLSFDATPPLHPNAVTLRADNSDAYHALARELIQANVSESFAIKDSFGTLDLLPLGFKILFDAQWIYLGAAERTRTESSDLDWEEVTTASALKEWEQAWSKHSSDVNGIFLSGLCHSEDVLILGVRLNGAFVAGCIANKDAESVGVSNIFLPQENPHSYRRSCIDRIRLAFPSLPLVGYESGTDLQEMQDVGFSVIGGLRVWYYESDSA